MKRISKGTLALAVAHRPTRRPRMAQPAAGGAGLMHVRVSLFFLGMVAVRRAGGRLP
jgi:hypothetical protein